SPSARDGSRTTCGAPGSVPARGPWVPALPDAERPPPWSLAESSTDADEPAPQTALHVVHESDERERDREVPEGRGDERRRAERIGVEALRGHVDLVLAGDEPEDEDEGRVLDQDHELVHERGDDP